MVLAIQTKSSGGEYQEVPKGTYAAKLVDVIDEGFREDKFPKSPGDKKMQYRLTYLLSEPMADGRPFVISEWVNIATLHADGSESRGALYKNDGKMSNFVARVEALTGMDLEAVGVTRFDDEMELAEWLIGKGCMVQVGVKPNGKSKRKSKIAGVMALPRGMSAPMGEYTRKHERAGGGSVPAPVYAPGRNPTTLPDEPEWFTEVLTVGKFKGKTWSDMASGGMDGGRHSWLKFVVAQDVKTSDQAQVQQRAQVVLAMYEARNAPSDDDAGTHF